MIHGKPISCGRLERLRTDNFGFSRCTVSTVGERQYLESALEARASPTSSRLTLCKLNAEVLEQLALLRDHLAVLERFDDSSLSDEVMAVGDRGGEAQVLLDENRRDAGGF